MGEEASEGGGWDINLQERTDFFLRPQTQNIPAASGPDGCAPTFAVNARSVTFNRLTKTIYHAFTYTEQYKTG